MKAKLLLSLSGGLMILVIWLGLSPAAQAVPQACTPTTQHGGWITSDETWCLATGSVHTVSDYVAVQAGVTVTIEPGVTVTAYEYVPATDNWRLWPAHLYNDQINPQVVGENGYFAFFTPPGHYYLQVDAPAGYQSWRSPVIEVVNEIVHANAPLTPVAATAVQNIPVDESALSLPQVTIFVGQSVTWMADDSWLAPDQYISLSENPMQRILSELDPLADVLGFDSGRMIPGQSYSRRFVAVGTYEYTDGYGRSGQIVVRPFDVLLPLVVK